MIPEGFFSPGRILGRGAGAEDIGNFWGEQTFAPVDVSLITSVSLFVRQPEVAISAIWLIYGVNDFDQFLIFPGAAWAQVDITGQMRGSGQLEGIRIWGYSGGGAEPDLTRVDDVDIQMIIPVELEGFTID